VNDVTRRAVTATVQWLERNKVAAGDEAISLQLLKISEEAGEAAGAWIGALGQNPRKGVTHLRSEVADELADVVMTALVAIESLGFDPEEVLTACAEKVLARVS
jgi:NTP pyrophosphatase (non-canonical NTP hydrolase)